MTRTRFHPYGQASLTCSGGGGDPVESQAPECIVRATCGNSGGLVDGDDKKAKDDQEEKIENSIPV